MTRTSVWHEIRCDHRGGCSARLDDENPFNLRDMAELNGWQIDVKLNGERASRGGKDYCPMHRRGGGSGV